MSPSIETPTRLETVATAFVLRDVAEPRSTPSATARAARRLLDVVVATVVLILLLPALALVVLAIRLESPGPALFRQRRLGRDRKPFTVLKFRSMHAAADSAPHRAYVQALIEGRADAEDGLYKLTGDPRVTRVGAFLRKTSLDELPQLFNVLRGDMSIVGPRPVVGYEVECYPDWFMGRFAVRPGVTGLWQVSGRNRLSYVDMVRLDVEYAERQSLRLDVQILLKSIWVVLRRSGAA